MSSIIQPVCRRLPAKKRLWDETDLPLSLLLTPLADSKDEPSSSSSLSNEKTTTTPPSTIVPISAIPKCLECGAPHPPGMKSSHYALKNSLMCYLCGYESSTTIIEQEEYRSEGEDGLNRRLYQEIKEDRPYSSSSSSVHEFSIQPSQKKKMKKKKGGQSYQGSSGDGTITTTPAMACPPLWWIILDGTSCPSLDYWTGISKSLLHVLEQDDVPEHVHIGSILVTTTTHVSVWDISSTIPHVEHYLLEDLALVRVKPVPLTGTTKSNILATMDALAKAGPEISSSTSQKQNNNKKGMKLGPTLQIVLDFVQEYTHPGMLFLNQEQQQGGNGNNYDDELLHPPTYAGGKITVILHGPPEEVGRSPNTADDILIASSTTTTTTTIGRGGVGGAAVEVGHRYSDVLPIPTPEEHDAKQQRNKKKKTKKQQMVMEEDEDEEPYLTSDDDLEMGGSGLPVDKVVAAARRNTKKQSTTSKTTTKNNNNNNDDEFIIPGDLHPEHLNEMYPYRMKDQDIVEYFEDLGRQAGEAALGVDVFVIVEAHDMLREIPYGLVFLKLLAERSGAAPGGPVLLRTDRMDQLTQELSCRVPWKAGIAFGGVLRLRTSPGFEVDPQSMTKVRGLRDCPQLAPSYVQKGLMGVGMATDELGLWQLGTLDTHTTVVVDLLMKQRQLKKHGYMEGMGEVVLKSGFQMCLVYTTIQKDPGDDGQYYTEQRMRVVTLNAPTTESSEVLYAHLDPEALLAVFYHKLVLVAYAGGLEHVQEDAYKWLQSFLSGVYHSAVEFAEDNNLRQQQQQGAAIRGGGGRGDEVTFHTRDRTLDEYGNSTSDTLSRDEILLGVGHEAVCPVVLLTWSLMQSDAFRPSIMVSSDARVAAMGQMATMMAAELSRCVAPRLELWIGEERIVENVDLSLATIQMYLEDLSLVGGAGQQQQQQQSKKQKYAVLLLDSPAEILVCHAGVLKRDGITISRPMKPITPSQQLMDAVKNYVQSYQVPPKVFYSLDGSPSSAVSIMDRWRDYFLEDSVCALGSVSFRQWKEELAAAVGTENGVLLGE